MPLTLFDFLQTSWEFEEPSGNFIDSVIGLTLVNTSVTNGATGIFNFCGSYNGSTSFAQDGSNPAVNFTGNFTIEAWIKPIDDAVEGQKFIVSKRRLAAISTGYEIVFERNVGAPRVSTIITTGGTSSTFTGTSVLSFGQVYQLVLTKSGGAVVLYLNGVSEASGTKSGSTSNTSAFSVGRRTATAGTNFSGLIDRVRTWNVALSSTEVARLYNNGVGTDYPFVPVITAIVPTRGLRNTSIPFTMYGNNLDGGGGQSTFIHGTEVIFNGGMTIIGATSGVGTFGASSTLGLWDVVGQTDDGPAPYLFGAFTTFGANPSLTSITPATGAVNTTVPFAILGDNLDVSGLSFTFTKTAQPTLTATNVSASNRNNATGQITLTPAIAGLYTVNAETDSGFATPLTDAFTVTGGGGPTPPEPTPLPGTSTSAPSDSIKHVLSSTRFEGSTVLDTTNEVGKARLSNIATLRDTFLSVFDATSKSNVHLNTSAGNKLKAIAALNPGTATVADIINAAKNG